MAGVQARVEELTRSVPIPEPWSIVEFVDAVAAHRGRPIILYPIESDLFTATGWCGTPRANGLWCKRREDDLIVYRCDTSRRHVDNIILHELGHMILGHDLRAGDGTGASTAPTLEQLMPSIAAGTIRTVLARDSYSTDTERDAEIFASLLGVRTLRPRRRRDSPLRKTFFRDGRR